MTSSAWFTKSFESWRHRCGVTNHATLSTTALVHEAWMKLKDSPHLGTNSAPHFKAIAARAMRQILVEEAKHHLSRCTTLPMERLPMPRKCSSLIRPYNS